MKKRILAMIMTLAMCLSLLPTAAFAAGDTEAPTNTNAAQIVDGYFKVDNGELSAEKTDDPINSTTGGKVSVSKTISPTETEMCLM